MPAARTHASGMGDSGQSQHLTPAEHKTKSRIEAFSDIVFGFSLFNLALNLHAPNSPSDLLAQGPQFIAFFGTFGILCSLWWLHHRIFLEFFKPDNTGIILNFFLLGAVAMFTYPLQLFMKFGSSSVVTFAAYAAGGALVYGLNTTLLVKGIRQLGDAHARVRRDNAVMLASRLAIVTASMLLALILARQGPITMSLCIASGAIVAAVVTRIQKRVLKSAAPGD